MIKIEIQEITRQIRDDQITKLQMNPRPIDNSHSGIVVLK